MSHSTLTYSLCSISSFSYFILHLHLYSFFFFFTDPATTEIYTLSLHDALPISFRRDLVNPPRRWIRRPRLRRVNSSIRCHLEIVEARRPGHRRGALRLAGLDVEPPHGVDIDDVEHAVGDVAAERVVEGEAIAIDANPFQRVRGAVGVDERDVAVIRHHILGHAGVHGDIEIALGVVRHALGKP